METQDIAESLLYSINNAVDYIREGSDIDAIDELEEAKETIMNTLMIRPEALTEDEEESLNLEDDIPALYKPLDFNNQDCGRRW